MTVANFNNGIGDDLEWSAEGLNGGIAELRKACERVASGAGRAHLVPPVQGRRSANGG
jgi:hypothetical protein